METIALVTGAAGGIGQELCRQLAEEGRTVVASPRHPSPALEALVSKHPDRFHIVPMDVGDEASIRHAAQRVGERVGHLDLLFNNAGVYFKDEARLEGLDADKLVHAYRVNAVGPLRVVAAFLPLLRNGREKRLVQVTSLMGSIEDNTSGGAYGYRMSKTALNMAVRTLAHELGPEGFLAVAVHPGWVRTPMGGKGAPLEVVSATQEVLRVALDAKREDNGAFLGPGGERLPW